MKSQIVFGDERLEKEFSELSSLKEKALYEQLNKAFKNLGEDAFCGIQIPKRLIPREYITRFGQLTNLWKYNLPDAWRLIYTIKNNQVNVLSIILEWLDHKEYERRFGY
jgi:Txe/YoeB family toxin of Txe-Axe toxin-antitoxin module